MFMGNLLKSPQFSNGLQQGFVKSKPYLCVRFFLHVYSLSIALNESLDEHLNEK